MSLSVEFSVPSLIRALVSISLALLPAGGTAGLADSQLWGPETVWVAPAELRGSGMWYVLSVPP